MTFKHHRYIDLFKNFHNKFEWAKDAADIIQSIRDYYKDQTLFTSQKKGRIVVDLASAVFQSAASDPAAALFDGGMFHDDLAKYCLGTEHINKLAKMVSALMSLDHCHVTFVFDGARNPAKGETDDERSKKRQEAQVIVTKQAVQFMAKIQLMWEDKDPAERNADDFVNEIIQSRQMFLNKQERNKLKDIVKNEDDENNNDDANQQKDINKTNNSDEDNNEDEDAKNNDDDANQQQDKKIKRMKKDMTLWKLFPDKKDCMEAFSVTPEITIFCVRVICETAAKYEKELFVDFNILIAPYEADSQVASMTKENGFAHAAMGVDGDLYTYGCKVFVTYPSRLLHRFDVAGLLDDDSDCSDNDQSVGVDGAPGGTQPASEGNQRARILSNKVISSSQAREFTILNVQSSRGKTSEDKEALKKLQPSTDDVPLTSFGDNVNFCFTCVHILSGCDYCPTIPGIGPATAREMCREVINETEGSFDFASFLEAFLGKVCNKWVKNKMSDARFDLLKRSLKSWCDKTKINTNFGDLFAEDVDQRIKKPVFTPAGSKITKQEQKEKQEQLNQYKEDRRAFVFYQHYVVLFCRAISTFYFQYVLDGFQVDKKTQEVKLDSLKLTPLNGAKQEMIKVFRSVFTKFDCWVQGGAKSVNTDKDKDKVIAEEIDFVTRGSFHDTLYPSAFDCKKLFVTDLEQSTIFHPRAEPDNKYQVEFCENRMKSRVEAFLDPPKVWMTEIHLSECDEKELVDFKEPKESFFSKWKCPPAKEIFRAKQGEKCVDVGISSVNDYEPLNPFVACLFSRAASKVRKGETLASSLDVFGSAKKRPINLFEPERINYRLPEPGYEKKNK